MRESQSDISSSKDSIVLTPNPAHDYLNISFVSEDEEAEIQILDVMGKIVVDEILQNSVNNEFLVYKNIDQLLPGLYFVRVQTSKGGETRLFVKE